MQKRRISKRKIELNMTPMIDIIFQLLAFFVMTLKIAAPEGDFSIKMPPAGRAEASVEMPPEPLRVRLSASPAGKLTAITLGDRVIGTNFADLRKKVLLLIQQRGGPDKADVEVELAPDENLRYEYVIEAMTAVTGEMRDGNVYRICNKIKFAPRRK
ncbi:MAG: biopolymer transporter ExbD [Planctomycetaceae bacterium]|nr:biopolymer transporter ExbD [Planctomycetaceae bacterium]